MKKCYTGYYNSEYRAGYLNVIKSDECSGCGSLQCCDHSSAVATREAGYRQNSDLAKMNEVLAASGYPPLNIPDLLKLYETIRGQKSAGENE